MGPCLKLPVLVSTQRSPFEWKSGYQAAHLNEEILSRDSILEVQCVLYLSLLNILKRKTINKHCVDQISYSYRKSLAYVLTLLALMTGKQKGSLAIDLSTIP